ncbi:hypothetical protein CASFOL_022838 [Castilleja foliolosa]|uniref:Uncharacterized protein n=1 Tax=Castilleja foliolosa TaxID=1961234 RepID=A0ABD3CWY0_9LAMI
MDFSVIRPKPPVKKPSAQPPAPAAPPPQPPKPAPPPDPPKPAGPPPLPPPPFGVVPPPGPYTEDHLDQAYRMYNPISVEYKNARTWTMNYDNYSDNYGDYYYSHHPVRIKRPTNNNDHPRMMMGGPLPRHQALPPPGGYHYSGLPPPEYQRLSLPPPDLHCGPHQQHGLALPDHHHHRPQRLLGLPPMEYHHGPQQHGHPPMDYHQGPAHMGRYYHPTPYPGDGGGFYGDENMNGCMIM